MRKKVVVLGGGTGLSTLLRGLKQFPIDVTAVVSVSDDGRSTGRLRKEFNTPAVGDIRQVLVALSEVEPLVAQLLNYRFQTTSDLNGHAVGNLLLTAMDDITGNMSDGIEALGKILNLKGSVLPLTEDNVILMAEMKDGSVIEGEHHITDSPKDIKRVFYKEEPVICPKVLDCIEGADLIVLSMGSLFTSILPNLISDEIRASIQKSHAKILYVCNMMTQPGETDGYKVSDHIKTINQYLPEKKVGIVVVNTGKIEENLIQKYASLEQKDPVLLDVEELNKMDVRIIEDDFVFMENNTIRHNTMKLAFHIFSSLI